MRSWHRKWTAMPRPSLSTSVWTHMYHELSTSVCGHIYTIGSPAQPLHLCVGTYAPWALLPLLSLHPCVWGHTYVPQALLLFFSSSSQSVPSLRVCHEEVAGTALPCLASHSGTANAHSLFLSSAALCLEYLPLSHLLHDASGSRACPLWGPLLQGSSQGNFPLTAKRNWSPALPYLAGPVLIGYITVASVSWWDSGSW